jgi:hypothetical protein
MSLCPNCGTDHSPDTSCPPMAKMFGGAEAAVSDLGRVLGGYCTVGNFIDDHPFMAALVVIMIVMILWNALGCSSPKLSKFADDVLPAGFLDSWTQGVDHRYSAPSYMNDSYTQVPLRYR